MQYFSAPEVVYGQDSLNRLRELKGEKAFIVTDKNIMRLGFIDQVKERLSQAEIKSTVFSEVEPEPSFETARRGAALMRQLEPDWVIAVGGGSVMDAAKTMRADYERPDIKLEEINPFTPDLVLGMKAKFICISTTSGTGSEETAVAVITDTAHQKKAVLVNRALMADIAIIYPPFASAMPQAVTAQTGMDVLGHAVEGFTSNFKNDFSDGLCLKAIQLVFQYLPRAYKDGQDMEAREKMHNAAAIAGIGFSNAQVALAHATATPLGVVFHVPHGRTVGLFLPYTIEFIGDIREELWAEIVSAIKLRVPKGKKASSILAQAIRKLAKSINEPTSIKELGIPSDKFNISIKKLVADTMTEVPVIEATARRFGAEECQRFFQYAYEGKSIDF